MAEEKPKSAEQNQQEIPDAYDRATEHIFLVVRELDKESDRACVIVAAARADYLLSQILTKFLLPNTASQDDLLDSEAALGTFSSRIHATYRLGLIDSELTRALHLLRKMRNSFAHETLSAHLDEASHRDRVREIVAPMLRYDEFEKLKALVVKEKKGIAGDFCASVAVILSRLEGLLEDVEPIHREWTCGIIPPVWIPKKK